MLTESFTRDVLFETLEALDELTEEVIEIWVQCGPNGLPDIDRLHTMYERLVDWVRPLPSSLTEERDETVQTLSIGPEIAQQITHGGRFVIEPTFGNMFVICVVSPGIS